MNIMEAFQKKLAVSEKVYEKEHGGRALSENKKIAIARVLANTSEYITEAFENSVGTQLSNMKTFKKFCVDLTTVALPSLISNDLVIVYPLKSRTGYIQYLKFTAGSNKGGVKQGDLFNDVFALGAMTDERMNYTGANIVESIGSEAVSFTPAWTPVIGKVEVHKVADDTWEELPNENFVAGTYDKASYVYDNVKIPQNDIPQYTATLEGMELSAKARRIGIYYSQMAA